MRIALLTRNETGAPVMAIGVTLEEVGEMINDRCARAVARIDGVDTEIIIGLDEKLGDALANLSG